MNFTAALGLCLLMIGTAGGQTADLILINGNVRTLDQTKPKVEAVAVSNGRIIAVGNSLSVKALADAKTTVIDAKGKLVLPGFNDAHVHLTGIGNLFSHLDLRTARSLDDVIGKVGDFTMVLPKGRWIIGAGLSLDRTTVDLEALDHVSINNPVLLYFKDPSMAFVNSAALRAAKTKAAVVSGDADGKPPGLLTGAGVIRIRNAVPPDHSSNWAEIVETASNYAASLGVTSVQDVHSDDLSATLQQLSQTGRLKTRVYDCIGLKERVRLVKKASRPQPATSWFGPDV